MFLAIVPLIVAVVNKSHSCHFPPLTSALGGEKKKREKEITEGKVTFFTLTFDGQRIY